MCVACRQSSKTQGDKEEPWVSLPGKTQGSSLFCTLYNGSMPTLRTSTRYVLSVGGGMLRLWDKERGLVAEIPPCVVVEKETGELKLYGDEAAALEGKTPDHLEFVRVWSGDKVIDRTLLRSLLQYLLHVELSSWSELWRRRLQTTLVIPETVSPLHVRWLRRTAREAGWFLTPTVPMMRSFLQQQNRPASAVQSVLDLGFTGARLVVAVGEEVLLAESESSLSLQAYTQRLSEYLLRKYALEVAPSVFNDQLWQQTRYMFDQQKKMPQQYAPTQKDLQIVNKEWQGELVRFVQQQLQQLSDAQQAELQKQGVWLLGGAADLLSEELVEWPLALKRTSDAKYAVLRSLSKKGKS